VRLVLFLLLLIPCCPLFFFWGLPVFPGLLRGNSSCGDYSQFSFPRTPLYGGPLPKVLGVALFPPLFCFPEPFRSFFSIVFFFSPLRVYFFHPSLQSPSSRQKGLEVGPLIRVASNPTSIHTNPKADRFTPPPFSTKSGFSLVSPCFVAPPQFSLSPLFGIFRGR